MEMNIPQRMKSICDDQLSCRMSVPNMAPTSACHRNTASSCYSVTSPVVRKCSVHLSDSLALHALAVNASPESEEDHAILVIIRHSYRHQPGRLLTDCWQTETLPNVLRVGHNRTMSRLQLQA